MGEFVRVASLEELPDGALLGVEAEGKRICLARLEDAVYAFADNCTHRDFPLSNGELDPDDCTVTCEWHGAVFDVRTGEVRCPPAPRPVATFAVEVRGGELWVDVG